MPIRLKRNEIAELHKRTKGQNSASVARRAQILLLSHAGKTREEIASVLGCSAPTVGRVRSRYRAEGWQSAIEAKHGGGRPHALGPADHRALIALACTKGPDGESRWTLRALAKKTGFKFTTIQRTLAADGIKPWREKKLVHPESGR